MGTLFACMPPSYPIIRAPGSCARRARPRRGSGEPRGLPGAVTLADALQVLLLMLDGDDPAFETAAVRWVNRFTGECRGVALTEVHAAVEALDGLPAPDASATLTAVSSDADAERNTDA
jgi:hypothetical protein